MEKDEGKSTEKMKNREKMDKGRAEVQDKMFNESR